jgi:hypothetical protein
MFMDEMEEMIKQLEDENALLQGHLESIDGETSLTATTPPAMVSPMLLPAVPPQSKAPGALNQEVSFAAHPPEDTTEPLRETPTQRKQLVKQLTSLLVAAGAFEQQQPANSRMSSAITAVSTSTDASGNSSCSDDQEQDHRATKRQRLGEGPIPQSITTTCL